MKITLAVSHGKADVERSFSEIKLLFTFQRTRINDETLKGYKEISSYMTTYDRKP